MSLSLATIRNIASPNVKVSRLLLLAGASPDHISDCLGRAPLIGVYSHLGYVDMVTALIEFGADVNATNTDGKLDITSSSSLGCHDDDYIDINVCRYIVRGFKDTHTHTYTHNHHKLPAMY